MKVVVDKYIPFIQDALVPSASVVALEPEAISPEAVHDADALIIRTRTKVNAALLDGSSVQFVATATIGYDHIDTDYCRRHNIAFTSCPGCNAQAVCDYIEECLRHLNLPSTATIGIVGVGHVGSLVAKMVERKGYQFILNDPPKNIGKSIDEIAQKCDFITFHTRIISVTSTSCNAANPMPSSSMPREVGWWTKPHYLHPRTPSSSTRGRANRI